MLIPIYRPGEMKSLSGPGRTEQPGIRLGTIKSEVQSKHRRARYYNGHLWLAIKSVHKVFSFVICGIRDRSKRTIEKKILYFDRLSGSQPFWHHKQAVMLRSIITCQYSLDTDVWNDISESARDMVCGMMTYIVYSN
jgi:hypothetical protein